MVKQYKHTGKYRVVEISHKKKNQYYISLPESTVYWSDLKERAKKDNVNISYRAETINGRRRVYSAIIIYSNDFVEQYFLTTSKKNQSW